MSRTFASPVTWAVATYALALAWMPADGFWINDNGLKFIQLRAFELNGFAEFSIPWPGSTLDPEFALSPLRPPFALVSEGRLFAAYPPVFALLSAIPHALMGLRGLSLLPLVGVIFTLLGVRRLGGELCESKSDAALAGRVAVGLAAFASPIAFYALTFWEHTPALALSTWCLVAALHYVRQPTHRSAAAVGLLAGLAIYLRTDAYLLGAIVVAVCAARRRKVGAQEGTLAVVTVFTLVPLWVFLWATTGNPLGLHLQAQEWGQLLDAAPVAQRIEVARHILLNAHVDASLSLLVALPHLLLALWVTCTRWRPGWLVPAALAWATLGGAIALLGHLLSARPMNALIVTNGLFAVSPALVLAFAPTRRSATPPSPPPSQAVQARRTLGWILGLQIALYIAVVPSRNAMGIHWGCRFLLIAYPILCAMAAPTLVALWSPRAAGGRWVRALCGTAVVLSVAFQVYSVELLRARKVFTSTLTQRVAAMQADAIATPVWHLPQDLATIFYQRPIFLTRTPDEAAQLTSRAHRHGIDEVLLIAAAAPGASPAEGASLVSDGWLGFSSVVLRVRRIGGPEAPPH